MSQPSMDDLKALLELQAVDAKVRRTRHHLDALPEQQQLDEAAATLDQSQERAAGLRLEQDRIQAEVARCERELKVFRERLVAEEQRLYGGGVTDARSMKGVEAEIASTRQRIDDLETEELEALEAADDLDARMAAEADTTAASEAAVEAARAALDTAAQETLATLAELEVDRDRRRENLPSDLLARYDEVIARGDLQGIGELQHGTCTACGVALAAIQVNKVRREAPLTTCPCDRELLLVVER